MLEDLLLENLEIVVDGTGKKKKVQLPWAVWESLLEVAPLVSPSGRAASSSPDICSSCSTRPRDSGSGTSGL